MDKRLEDHYRILFITHQFSQVTSGPGVYARNLLNQLLKDGHSVTLITQAGETGDLPGRVRVICVPKPPARTGQARWFLLSRSYRKAMHGLATAGESFDLVHYADAREACFCPMLWPSIGNVNDTYSLEREHPPYYLTNYIDGLPRWMYYRINRLFERHAYRKLDRVIANSQYTEHMLLDSFPELQGKTTTIYKSIDRSKFIPRQQDQTGNPTLLLVGSNLQRKGVMPLLKAAALLKPRFQNLQVFIVGDDPNVRKYLQKSQALGIRNSCRFFGGINQAQLPDIYRQATIYCLPSLKEALGISVLEAMATGIPVVASRTGGIPEIIQDGINGLLCEPGDAESLAKCISRLLLEPDLADKCIQAGFTTGQKYSVENMYAEIQGEYNRLLSA